MKHRGDYIEEIWKPIEGYSNYNVSNLGRIKNINTGKILKGNNNGNGYFHVVLYNENHIGKAIMIHRIVAKAFIPNPLGLPQVNHIDECKHNNCAYNLEWITSEDNINHGTHNLRVGLNNPNRIPIISIDQNGESVHHNSARDAVKYYARFGIKMTPAGITKALKGQIYTYKNLAWFKQSDLTGIRLYKDKFNYCYGKKNICSVGCDGDEMQFGSLCEAVRYYDLKMNDRAKIRSAIINNDLFIGRKWAYTA